MVFVDYGSEIDLRIAPAQTLTDLFGAMPRAYPDRVAISLPSTDISYSELDAWSDEEARHLRAAGAGPDEYVGVSGIAVAQRQRRCCARTSAGDSAAVAGR